ncbi:hypothetical protein N5915_04255 [Arcobacter lacus]|uniref:hypothetical protein n=1 Tax=Arcobacter lacus TaxID=1912876 RepID=UPI0021BB9784|nr:hypothetical protein [Arcobacter lacus]MCT7908763.1 hypothetical protein [Arcobacter lacus]
MSANEVIEINKIKLDGALTILNLNANMDQLENAVIKELEKPEYNSIVTMTNFKDMKESSLFLGKVAKQISDFRIAKVKEETTDIKLFEDSLKKFTNMFKSKQDVIKQGLDVFEEETRKQIKEVCITYLNQYCLEVGLKEKFQNINLEDMTQTGFMTASGSISKKGKEEVEKRVQVQLNLQNKVQNRLMMLENECLKAGIEPLTKQHIQGFLFADDNTYISNLNMLIESELRRAEQIKAKQEQELRQKIEAETSAKNALVEEERTPFDEPVKKEDLNLEEVTREINGQKIVIAYMTTDDKTDYIYNLKKELVSTIYNNDYKVVQVLDRLEKEVIGLKSEEYPKTSSNDEKVMKTLSCTIRVQKDATDEQVINAVIRMIKDDKFPIENIKVE